MLAICIVERALVAVKLALLDSVPDREEHVALVAVLALHVPVLDGVAGKRMVVARQHSPGLPIERFVIVLTDPATSCHPGNPHRDQLSQCWLRRWDTWFLRWIRDHMVTAEGSVTMED